METMRYQEKKKSYKGVVVAFFLFVLLGGGLIVLALHEEKAPAMIGKVKEETQNLVDVDSKIENKAVSDMLVETKDKVIKNNDNVKLKGSMTLPQVSIDAAELTTLNAQISDEYVGRFNSLKDLMQTGENKYTYQVSYRQYDNMVGAKRLVSLTIYQAIIDDATKKSTTDKIETYNIDVAAKNTIQLSDVIVEILGKDYKEKVKESLKKYVVANGMMKEADFTYTVTGLEAFYIKDSKLHMVFNEGELVDKKYNVVDITIN